jgi:hypothetical protein
MHKPLIAETVALTGLASVEALERPSGGDRGPLPMRWLQMNEGGVVGTQSGCIVAVSVLRTKLKKKMDLIVTACDKPQPLHSGATLGSEWHATERCTLHC